MNISENTKKVVYGVVALAVLVGIIFGFSKRSAKPDNLSDYSVSQLRDSGLTDDQKQEALKNKLSEFQGVVSNLPQDANSSDKYSAYIVLSEVQIALEMYDEALKSLESIPEDKRNSKRAYYQFAQIYKAKNDLFKAMEYSLKAIERDSGDVPSWLLYIDSASNLTNEELNTKYREAIAATKSNIEIMISYAKFSERIGDKATAIAAWETAANVDPANEGKYREEITRLRQ